MPALASRNINQQQQQQQQQKKAAASERKRPSLFRTACPGCYLILPSLAHLPNHITSGECTVFRELPQQQQQEQHHATPARQIRCNNDDDDDDDDGDDNNHTTSCTVSPFLARRMNNNNNSNNTAERTTLPTQKHECSRCGTRGDWIPSAPARSTVRLLVNNNRNASATTAICTECISDMFKSATAISSLEPLKVLSGGGETGSSSITENDTIGIITARQWENLHSSVMSKFVDQQVAAGVYLRCPGCDLVAECVPADSLLALASSSPSRARHGDKDPKKISVVEGITCSHDAARHYQQHRIRCTQCSITFCSSCLATPYHVGMTCEELAAREQCGSCRFCEKPVGNSSKNSNSNTAAASSSSDAGVVPIDVCGDPECRQRGKLCCSAIRKCGHPCYFSCSEPHSDEHHICLVPGCPDNTTATTMNVTRDDWCSICYCEALAAGPVVRLTGCGHIYHLDCVRQKIAAKWPGPRISFGFLGCAMCKVEMDAPELRSQLESVSSFRRSLQKLMLERLVYEGLDKRSEIVSDKSSPYFGRPEIYAEHTFAFYPCFKCGSPFFGGHNRCADALNDDNNNNNNSFDPKDLLCSKCIPDGQKRSCRIHGSTFITFKCKFCCNVAAFFCWGNTHFCAQCHNIQERGTFLNKLPVSELPVCPGLLKCPLGVEHPPNGTAEFALGCALCK